MENVTPSRELLRQSVYIGISSSKQQLRGPCKVRFSTIINYVVLEQMHLARTSIPPCTCIDNVTVHVDHSTYVSIMYQSNARSQHTKCELHNEFDAASPCSNFHCNRFLIIKGRIHLESSSMRSMNIGSRRCDSEVRRPY